MIPGIKRVVSRLKSNLVVIYKGKPLRVDELWKLPGLAFRHDRKKHFKWATITVRTAGLAGELRLVLVQELDDKRPWRIIAQYVLVCTDPEWSASKIVAAYKLRWGIEVFYRTAKQRFSLTDFHARPFVDIHCHITFVILAYLMTAVLREFNPELLDHTLGEIIEEYLRCLVSIKRRGNEIIVSIGPTAAALFGIAPAPS
jgi:IS4 transposase